MAHFVAADSIGHFARSVEGELGFGLGQLHGDGVAPEVRMGHGDRDIAPGGAVAIDVDGHARNRCSDRRLIATLVPTPEIIRDSGRLNRCSCAIGGESDRTVDHDAVVGAIVGDLVEQFVERLLVGPGLHCLEHGDLRAAQRQAEVKQCRIANAGAKIVSEFSVEYRLGHRMYRQIDERASCRGQR